MATEKRLRRDKQDSRDQILDKTLKVIAKDGWANASFQSIAKKTGMSTSNIVYHFGNKQTLLFSLLERITTTNWDEVAKRIKPESNAFERLTAHFDGNLSWAAEYPEQAHILMQIYANASHDKEFSKLYSVMTERAHERIKEILLAGKRERLFHFAMETDLLTKTLHDLLVGSFIKKSASRTVNPISYPIRDWKIALASLTSYKD